MDGSIQNNSRRKFGNDNTERHRRHSLRHRHQRYRGDTASEGRMLARDYGRQTDPDQDSLRDGPEHDNEGEAMQMKNHEKAAAI